MREQISVLEKTGQLIIRSFLGTPNQSIEDPVSHSIDRRGVRDFLKWNEHGGKVMEQSPNYWKYCSINMSDVAVVPDDVADFTWQ